MRKSLVAGALFGLVALSQPALAAFVGPTAPNNWTITNTGTLIGPAPSPGFAQFTTETLTLVGSNAVTPGPTFDVPACVGGVYGELGPCQLRVTIQLNGMYTFNFDYTTTDFDGPLGDIFGVLVDGMPIMLSDPGGGNSQSGHASFTAMSSFGFFIDCTDCVEGRATVVISDFWFVPEPSSTALLLAGALGWGALRLRRRETPVV
ncbi:PEP-CTERM sorting domain-containing protein [Piscinibacter koreensis]|uniref:PEP-CTERM sorting domain-containing protein n=1 Tax=Piscinibacter koreensis TaxID=2742824 RepID=A0A7Y6TX94_9BURK|nr:PEP-CTERM sorting domain-containing protein [Schlegelella koreensis]NUZ06857.1 PEP-CTERM sorting domain-containing protein [Schlegelella koreensis]